MPETIKTKRCSKCKQIKTVSGFYKNRSTKDRLQDACKSCHKAYGKAYRQSEEGRAYQKAYQQSETGKAARKRSDARHRAKFPEKKKAGNAVIYAVKTGKLPRPDSLQCSCGEQAEQYHHHKGYAPERWLDVVPVCRKCHYQN